MTTTAGVMLVTQIMPLIAAAVARGAIRGTGCEDIEELTAEGCAMAARALESAERRGKEVPARSVAYYALQALKQGRRSGYFGTSDVMSAGAAVRGRASVRSLDEPIGSAEDDPDEDLTLHTCLASPAEDPARIAGRSLDWSELCGGLDGRRVAVVRSVAQGHGTKAIARKLRVSQPRITGMKREIGRRIVEKWGTNATADAVRESKWREHVRVAAQRRACRYDRAHR